MSEYAENMNCNYEVLYISEKDKYSKTRKQ